MQGLEKHILDEVGNIFYVIWEAAWCLHFGLRRAEKPQMFQLDLAVRKHG